MKVTLVQVVGRETHSSSNPHHKFIGVVKGDEILLVHGFVHNHGELVQSSEYIAFDVPQPTVAGKLPELGCKLDSKAEVLEMFEECMEWRSSAYSLETPRAYREPIMNAFAETGSFHSQ
jgi:hypothetical protein